jgi:diaminohydroxyphosphoribosylaminopyrimidine deaminase / 5-amino-6-(5-phosphoribosylamino)uracil reductase
MQRCLELAQKGLGHVSPNPMVGCVIVHNDQIIGEGYHKFYGGPHAEVEAISNVADAEILKASTVYVSLEPCSHHGKTPPCSELLISKQVMSVVAGMEDPNPLVAGNGLKMLKEAGIGVVCGVLEAECRKLNKRFIINQLKHRPYVILKWAESADGYMASAQIKQISGLAAKTLLHKWRSEEDAFMVGTETLIQDNPQLNTRLWKGRDPVRVAVDRTLRSEGLPLNFYRKGQKSILINGIKNAHADDLEYVKTESTAPADILNILHERGIGSVVIEGGFQFLNSFLQAGLFDEIRVFRSKQIKLNGGIKAPCTDLRSVSQEELPDDILLIY